jgi:hypothetical protein
MTERCRDAWEVEEDSSTDAATIVEDGGTQQKLGAEASVQGQIDRFKLGLER